MRIAAELGVQLSGVNFMLWYAAAVVDYVHLQLFTSEATVTSGTEGKHTSGSLHARGLALDFRTRHLNAGQRLMLRDEVRRALGETFFVALEENPPHMHVQLGFENVSQRGLAEYGLA